MPGPIILRRRLTIGAGLALVVAAAISCDASADEIGVNAGRILFGQAAALDGPSSALGQGMRQGILAAFAEVNAKGGLHGRRLELISRDDGYDPDRSVAQTTRLIEEDKVFALIGAVGTPTTAATVPIAQARNVPFIGPFTGAAFLRAPELHNVVNIRASYGAEAEAWIKHLTEDLQVRNIAIFYQDDAFGRDGLAGVKHALAKRNMELTAEGTFERNTKAVGSALRTLKRTEPEAVVMVGPYGPCAEFIRLAHRSGFHPIFVNISFVGANALAKELGAEGKGVIVSQVVPSPWDASVQVVADYQAAEKALSPDLKPDFVSLEGYLAGRLAASALEMAGPEPTRAQLLRLVNDVGRFDISGDIMTFGPKAQDTPPKVFLTVIQPDGSFKSVDKLSVDQLSYDAAEALPAAALPAALIAADERRVATGLQLLRSAGQSQLPPSPTPTRHRRALSPERSRIVTGVPSGAMYPNRDCTCQSRPPQRLAAVPPRH
jgi:branched-chain amino acid transport system substrate-binding protein